MKTFDDLKQLIDQAEKHYDSLKSIAKDEVKEFGNVKPDTCKQINAIIFGLYNSYAALDKGLNGEF